MEWFHELLFGSGIGHSILLLAVVIFVGILLGKIKIAGISLGITWILFVGIILSHFNMRMDPEALHFLKEFGLSDAEINDVHIINDYGEYILGNDSKVESSLHRPNFGLYLGVGLGRPIPKRRVGFRVELGFPIFVGRTARHTDGWVSGNASTILIPLWGKSVENRSVFISPVLSFHVTFKLYNDNIRRKTAETD